MTRDQAGPGRWPDGALAAISLTMDNMGEANELELGTWPSTVPVGSHHSVTERLPSMLDVFDRHGARATYFVEAWNTDVYPDAVREVAGRGHEVGFHGFRHEAWGGLEPETEARLVATSVRRFADLGVPVTGFRPPGGGLNPDSVEILRSHGISYISPAGRAAAVDDDVVHLPFRWEWIDAFCYFGPLSAMRERAGLPAGILGSDTFAGQVDACLTDVVAAGGYTALLFHPFLHTSPDRLAVMDAAVERVCGDPTIWCAPCEEVAAWVREHPDRFPRDPGLIDASWMG